MLPQLRCTSSIFLTSSRVFSMARPNLLIIIVCCSCRELIWKKVQTLLQTYLHELTWSWAFLSCVSIWPILKHAREKWSLAWKSYFWKTLEEIKPCLSASLLLSFSRLPHSPSFALVRAAWKRVLSVNECWSILAITILAFWGVSSHWILYHHAINADSLETCDEIPRSLVRGSAFLLVTVSLATPLSPFSPWAREWAGEPKKERSLIAILNKVHWSIVWFELFAIL